MTQKTCLMIGGSGMAGGWIRNFVDNFSDRIKIIGLADVLPDVLAGAGRRHSVSAKISCSLTLTRHVRRSKRTSAALRHPRHSIARSDRCDGERNAGDLRKADRGYA